MGNSRRTYHHNAKLRDSSVGSLHANGTLTSTINHRENILLVSAILGHAYQESSRFRLLHRRFLFHRLFNPSSGSTTAQCGPKFRGRRSTLNVPGAGGRRSRCCQTLDTNIAEPWQASTQTLTRLGIEAMAVDPVLVQTIYVQARTLVQDSAHDSSVILGVGLSLQQLDGRQHQHQARLRISTGERVVNIPHQISVRAESCFP